ncbi:MAG: hypothetical protein V1664_05150 [Candidatus Uhrbacteria bacterium]
MANKNEGNRTAIEASLAGVERKDETPTVQRRVEEIKEKFQQEMERLEPESSEEAGARYFEDKELSDLFADLCLEAIEMYKHTPEKARDFVLEASQHFFYDQRFNQSKGGKREDLSKWEEKEDERKDDFRSALKKLLAEMVSAGHRSLAEKIVNDLKISGQDFPGSDEKKIRENLMEALQS